MKLNISPLISPLKYIILKCILSRTHIEALQDLNYSSRWLVQDMKTNDYLLKAPLDICVSEETGKS